MDRGNGLHGYNERRESRETSNQHRSLRDVSSHVERCPFLGAQRYPLGDAPWRGSLV